MNSKIAIQLCSVAILVSFFFPIFHWHGFEMSGLNYILSEHISSYKYALILIPFSALFLFWGSSNDGKYLFNKDILSLLPLIILILISIARFADSYNNSSYDNENPFLTIGTGFWLMLFFSVMLVLIKNEKKKAHSTF